MKLPVGAAIVALSALAASMQGAPAAGPEWRASLSAQSLVGLQSPPEQALRTQVLLEARTPFSATTALFGAVRLEADTSDRLEPGRADDSNRSGMSRRARWGDDATGELEEFYLDSRLGGWNLRMGKQQTVWGTSDGIKVLDIVNPQSFREFILDDYERSRIPLWSIAAVYAFGERSTLELIAIPDLTFHDIPEPGALFEITSPSLAPPATVDDEQALRLIAQQLSGGSEPIAALLQSAAGLTPAQLQSALVELLTPNIQQRTKRPQLGFKSAEYGLRLRGTAGDLEAALCVLRHHPDVPEVALSFPNTQEAVVTRRYLMNTSFGAQMSHPFAGMLMRFEGVYGTRSPIPALDLPGDGRSARAPSYGAVVGMDWSVRDAGLMSMQVGELGLRTNGDHYNVPRRNGFATLLWRDEILPGRLTGEAFSAISLQRGDRMLRARLLWQLRDDLQLQIGFDALGGDRDGIFGEFRRRDRVGLELAWSL